MSSYSTTLEMVGQDVPAYFDGEEKINDSFSLRFVAGAIIAKPKIILAVNGKFLIGKEGWNDIQKYRDFALKEGHVDKDSVHEEYLIREFRIALSD